MSPSRPATPGPGSGPPSRPPSHPLDPPDRPSRPAPGGRFTAVVVALGVAATLALHLAVTASAGVTGVDRSLARAMLHLRHPVLTDAASALTRLGGTLGLVTLTTVALGVLAVRRRSWEPVLVGAAAGLGSVAVTVAVKAMTARTRPPLADAVLPQLTSHAFPSGHSLNALVLAGVVAHLLAARRSSRAGRLLVWSAALLFALTIAATRVYLGRHWATDVLAAWSLGLAWLTLVRYLHGRLVRRGTGTP